MDTKDIIIDFRGVTSKAGFYDLIEEKLAPPEYFGRNLDALHDFLTETSALLTLSSFDELRKALGGYAAVLEDMLVAAAAENSRLTVVIED